MKTFATALACISFMIPMGAIAENRLDLFTDAAGTQCELTDTGSLQTIYVFLAGTIPATAVEFAAPRPGCWQGATWVGDILPGPRGTQGTTQGRFFTTLFEPGIGECKLPRVYVCGMLFVTTGASSPCCEIRVTPTIVPPPFVSMLGYYDCGASFITMVSGQKVVINANDGCHCMLPLHTESSSWGRVKSLYH